MKRRIVRSSFQVSLPALLTAAFAAGCGGAAPPAKTTDGKDRGAEEKNAAVDPSVSHAASQGGGIGALGQPELAGTGVEAAMTGPLRAYALDKGAPVKLDGVPKEWPHRSRATHVVGKASAGNDVTFASALQYDDQKLYIAGEVTDGYLTRTSRFGGDEDHASLAIAFPSSGSFAVYEIGLFPGKPGESVGSVRFLTGPKKGQEVPGSKIVEAPASGGLTFEAVVPWSTFAEARTLRVGLRGAVRYHDAESGAVLASGPGGEGDAQKLPPLPTEAEEAVVEGLLTPKGLANDVPKLDLFVDVSGDAMKERVSVFGHFLTVCGPGYRGGKQFFFRDLGGDVVRLDTRDVTGRGKEELLLRRRLTAPSGGTREWFEVWSFAKGDEPEQLFSHEIAIAKDGKRVSNAVRVSSKEIEVAIEPATGWDGQSYREPPVGDATPALLPWAAVKSRTYKWEGSKFGKVTEVAKTPDATPASAANAATPPAVPKDAPSPPVAKVTDNTSALLALYKRDRGVAESVKSRFGLSVNVAEDSRPETVSLVGRDVVVYGPGFLGGTQYTYLTASQFDADADITDLTAKDLTGDGAAEIVLRGTRFQTAGGERVGTDALFVYQVQSGKLVRIFGIETGRELGKNRIQAAVQFIPAKGGKGFDVDARPGNAKGWTDKTYPFAPQKPGSGPIEPLLLPWGGVPSARYTFDGKQYTLAK